MTKKILIVDPYYGGSHRHWADGLRKYSRFTISVLSLPARHWKWRMHGGAVTLAEEFNKLKSPPDLILATDMMDVATFIGLIQQTTKVPIPVVTYFHENQLAYPKSVQDSDLQTSRDDHYGFINYTSALVSDRVIFNSQYNQSTFLNLLKDMLSRLPDYQNIDTVSHIEQKSVILYPGIDTELFDSVEITEKKKILHSLFGITDGNMIRILNHFFRRLNLSI
ncbi:MAG: DUF3524 domain-containing protein [Candidatus Marinimicrobia bacterium]|nr:DUF3524 domain-containing protein [Candidatus Neomarinimicrobiota bacterium]